MMYAEYIHQITEKKQPVVAILIPECYIRLLKQNIDKPELEKKGSQRVI